MVLGTVEEFLSTSCIASLSFLGNPEEGDPDGLSASVKEYLEKELQKPFLRVAIQPKSSLKRKHSLNRSRKSGITGIIRRTRSIQVDQYDPGNYVLIDYLNSLFSTFIISYNLLLILLLNSISKALLNPYFESFAKKKIIKSSN